MSAQIIEVLNNICEKFGVAVDWTSKNIQPYLKELMTKCINYKLATHAKEHEICQVVIYCAIALIAMMCICR